MAGYKVGYFVGSLATKSINRLLAKALVSVAPPELQMTEISFKDLPLYSYDYDTNYPAVATEFKDAIAAVESKLEAAQKYPYARANDLYRGTVDLAFEVQRAINRDIHVEDLQQWIKVLDALADSIMTA